MDIYKLRNEFWNAPNDAYLSRKTTAAGLDCSVGYLELLATKGGGPIYLKHGRRCLYKKSSVLIWLEQKSKQVNSTSEYDY